jgi:UDP:flavonoid glycosyltransferase YjiC (YdhE family)
VITRPHIVLASIGTDGDIYPFLGLGIELRARGYEVTLATHERFADRAANAGIEFCLLLSDAEFDEVLTRPDFWHPIKGPIMMARWGARLLRRQYEVLSALAATNPQSSSRTRACSRHGSFRKSSAFHWSAWFFSRG